MHVSTNFLDSRRDQLGRLGRYYLSIGHVKGRIAGEKGCFYVLSHAL